jgi:hypothetical protein
MAANCSRLLFLFYKMQIGLASHLRNEVKQRDMKPSSNRTEIAFPKANFINAAWEK